MELLTKYLSNPLSVQEESNPAFWEEILNLYPYFQSAHILRCLSRKPDTFTTDNDYLMVASVYAGDREQLYNLIHGSLPDAENTASPKNRGEKTKEVPLKAEEATSRQKLTRQIIDHFLATNPTVNRPSSEFYDATAAASKSISSENEFISENLAKIYAKSGNTDKAIKIYQKLSLLYPEKTTYFALLIEELLNKKDQ